jgi:hypothetical protein
LRLLPLVLALLFIVGCGSTKTVRETHTITVTLTPTTTTTTTVVKQARPTPLVFVGDVSGDLGYEPDVIGLGASSLIDHINWSGYGRALAIGHGTFSKNDCRPSCAGGKITPVPATVKLRYRALCREKITYMQMAISAPGTSFDGHWDAVSGAIGAIRDAC